MSRKKKPSQPRALTDEEMGILVEDLKNFQRVHGVSYDEWVGLPLQVKAALVKASKELDAERILRLSQALSGRAGMLKVAAEIDGGDRLVEEGLLDGIRSALRKRGIAQ